MKSQGSGILGIPAVPPASSAVTVREITDPTTIGTVLEGIAQNAVQLQSGSLWARQVMIRLQSGILIFQATNLPVRTRTSVQEGYVAFVAFGPRSSGTMDGLPIGPDLVLVGTSTTEVEFVVNAGYSSVTFLLSRHELRRDLQRRGRDDEFQFKRPTELFQPGYDCVQALYGLGRRLVEMAARQPGVFDSPSTQAITQAEILEMLLSMLASESFVKPEPHDRTRQAHSEIIQAAENYAIAHAAQQVHVADLCEAAGVSERTLQYAFRELLGMTPMAFLKRLRLHEVRKSLRAASPSSTTVTKEALRRGYWHFGDFSRAYKQCFGESPSDTLRRPADERP